MTTYQTIVDALHFHAKNKGNECIYHYIDDSGHGEKLTYAELLTQASNMAVRILRKVEPGERVLLLFPPGLELIVAFYACLLSKTTAVLSYPPFDKETADKLAAIINDCEPAIILSNRILYKKIWFAHFARRGLINKFASLFTRIDSDMDLTFLWLSDAPNWLFFEKLATDSLTSSSICGKESAFLQYTSGSTGAPKGVIVSHENLTCNIEAIGKAFELSTNSIGVIWLPPYHDMGLIGGILAPLYYGFPVHLISPMNFIKNPLIWLQLITQYKATISGGPNFAYDYCVNKVSDHLLSGIDLSSWHVAFNGADVIQSTTLDRFSKKFESCGFNEKNFLTCYGLAEATLMVSAGKLNNSCKKIYVDANKLKMNQLQLVNGEKDNAQCLISSGETYFNTLIIETDGADSIALDEQQLGEICVTGKTVTPGYWQKERDNIVKPNGYNDFYLKTGDQGFKLNNQLFITGRLKDLIIVDGKNYYPHDIESASIGSNKYIVKGGVCAVPLTSETGFILLVEVKQYNLDKATMKEILNDVISSVSSRFKIMPKQVALLEKRSLPKTTSGKLQRKKTLQLYLNDEFNLLFSKKIKFDQPNKQINTIDFKEFIVGWFCEHCGAAINDVHDGANIMSFGLDSIAVVNLCDDINHQFEMRLVPEDIWHAKTVGTLVTRANSISLRYRSQNHLKTRKIKFVSKISLPLANMFTSIFYNIDAQGIENLPQDGNYIIASNHCSHLDNLILLRIISNYRPVVFAAAKDVFYTTAFRRFVATSIFNALPMDRFRFDIESVLPLTEQLIHAHCAVVIYPEGTRSLTGDLLPFKQGTAMLSMAANTPIVPAKIEGTFELYPKGQCIPVPGCVRVSFGSPLIPQDFERQFSTNKTRLEAMTKALYDSVNRL